MARILVVFASNHGQTRAIAGAIAKALGSHGHAVELADALAAPPPPPQDFTAVVLGSRIRTGTHAREIGRYVETHREALRSMPTAFFSVSLSAAQEGADADPNGYLGRFFDDVAWRPHQSEAFGGALAYSQYNWFLRQIMRLLARGGGHSTDASRDHEFTDWDAVERFAVAFASRLPARLSGS